jgi:hypothetical protein
MKIIVQILCGGIVFLLIATSISGGLQAYKENEYEKAVGIIDNPPIKTDYKPEPIRNAKLIDVDTPITNNVFDSSHPVIDLDYSGNPFLLYHEEVEFFDTSIHFRRSLDGGETWPEDYVWFWDLEDTSPINPDISFMEDGLRAFGTHENVGEEPFAYIHDYIDIESPDTYSMFYFDFSDSSTYLAETAVTTNGTTIVAIGTIVDYNAQGYDLQDTLKINWNAESGEGSWPGVFWINEDSEGNSKPRSHVCADAGDKMFFCYQQDANDENSKIYAAYCRIDATTEYTDWRTNAVAISNSYNATNPDISVSGPNAYIVYENDQNGNKDVYCAVTTSGTFWRKYLIADSLEDEENPVIYADGENAVCLFTKNNDLYSSKSTDGGQTWSTPVVVNDQPGSNVNEWGNADISGPYGVWTDSRNDNTDIFFDSVGATAILTIDEISGVFGLSITVSNVGNAPAEEVPWSIDIDGLVFLGSHHEGLETIQADETKQINSGIMFGFGKITINVVVDDLTKTAEGFLLGPFILNI